MRPSPACVEEDSASGVMVVGRAGTRGLSDGVACNDGKTLHTHAHHLAVKRPPPCLAAAQTQAPAPSTTEAAVLMPPAPPTLATPPCAPASRASLALATPAQVGASASHACRCRTMPPESCSRGCVVRDGVGTWCVQEGDSCAQPSSEHPHSERAWFDTWRHCRHQRVRHQQRRLRCRCHLRQHSRQPHMQLLAWFRRQRVDLRRWAGVATRPLGASAVAGPLGAGAQRSQGPSARLA